MKKYTATLSFEVHGEHTLDEVRELLYQASAQIEDPRDADGERVDFATSTCLFTLTES